VRGRQPGDAGANDRDRFGVFIHEIWKAASASSADRFLSDQLKQSAAAKELEHSVDHGERAERHRRLQTEAVHQPPRSLAINHRLRIEYTQLTGLSTVLNSTTSRPACSASRRSERLSNKFQWRGKW
jgi:hypothetical protein